MNKDSIYKFIGYKGEYNKEVKAKLRGLLKKYHPDHNNGNDETFKMISSIKKELENNKVNTNFKENETKSYQENTDLNDDFLYYNEQIKILRDKNSVLENKINHKNGIIERLSKKYNSINEKLTQNKEVLCANEDNVNYLKMFRKKYIIYILSFLIFMVIYLITQKILFLGLIVIVIVILSVDISRLYISIRELTSKSKNYLLKNFELFNEIERLKDAISEEKKDLLNLKREQIKNDNDIRFYQNQLNKK